jgi:hypothetical protein
MQQTNHSFIIFRILLDRQLDPFYQYQTFQAKGLIHTGYFSPREGGGGGGGKKKKKI